jgi:hypothetical protein
MGFISSANTITLNAKLTPLGRQRMVSTNNGLITTFSLGDSDANYYVPLTLSTGQIPAEAGEIGANASFSNSTAQNVKLKSPIIVNSSGLLRKPVESQSITVSTDLLSNGFTTVSGNNLTQVIIDRNNYNTDALVNLYYSFGLPLNTNNDNTYTGITYANGGYSDTALSAISQTKILLIGINNSNYGECIDGKTVKIELPTSAGTYTIYSTFQNNGNSLAIQDANIRDTSVVTSYLDDNIAMLFSDSIATPNGGSGSLSWATGYGTTKPFSINGKQLYNLQTNSNIGTTADTIVGIAYLDKGFMVITNQQIISNYTSTAATATTVSFNSVSTSVYQNITCVAARGEFGTSTNSTFTGSDVVRISEVGLYDNLNNLIAIAKTDRQVTKNVNEFLALSVKINL